MSPKGSYVSVFLHLEIQFHSSKSYEHFELIFSGNLLWDILMKIRKKDCLKITVKLAKIVYLSMYFFHSAVLEPKKN
jgi:hypothetical protein